MIMIVNNFELIRGYLSFKSPDIFYHLQIMIRKKDNPMAPANNRLIKAYYIMSIEQFDKVTPEIIAICQEFHARAYINLAPKSLEKCTLNTIAGLANRLTKGNMEKIWREFNSQAGLLKPISPAWVVDYDEGCTYSIEGLIEIINSLDPNPGESKVKLTIPTKSGVHLITSSFNLKTFTERFPDIDVHKNNPTLLYYNDNIEYPNYYKTVWCQYQFPGKDPEFVQAWLAVNDNGEYIWTKADDDTTIIPDKYVINWKPICL